MNRKAFFIAFCTLLLCAGCDDSSNMSIGTPFDDTQTNECDSCSSDEECANGKCIKIQEIPDDPDNPDKKICNAESCSGWCDDNDACQDYIPEGKTCTDTDKCENGLVCFEGICEPPWTGTDECHEKYKPCSSETAICLMGECLETVNCTSDADCQNDTYCCSEESCEYKDICIPYGKGPRGNSNIACASDVKEPMQLELQCEWHATENDVITSGNLKSMITKYKQVIMTPIVINTPHDTGGSNKVAVITAFTGTDFDNTGVSINDVKQIDGSCFHRRGIIRIIDGKTCKLLETINPPFLDSKGNEIKTQDSNVSDLGDNLMTSGGQLAAADVDGDGNVEIFATRIRKQTGKSDGKKSYSRNGGGLVAFKWNAKKKQYVTYWSTESTWDQLPTYASETNTMYVAGAPAIYDLNGDGTPEITCKGEVFNAKTGKRLNASQTLSRQQPVIGDIDGNKTAELLDSQVLYQWKSNAWQKVTDFGDDADKIFADFGTPDGDKFDFTKLDGKAEIISCGKKYVRISSKDKTSRFTVKTMGDTALGAGGPCSVADFDGDGLPEIVEMFTDNTVKVFDPQCGDDTPGCKAKGILWSHSQSIKAVQQTAVGFDLDGDGTAEVITGTENYLHILDGKTGKLLDSAFRTIRNVKRQAFYEYPVVADVDNDGSAEIIVSTSSPSEEEKLDAKHRGIQCNVDMDCKSSVCIAGLCRCSANVDCNYRIKSDNTLANDYKCTDGINENDQKDGKVCRAQKPTGAQNFGVRIFRERKDRWTGTRNLWNQFAYHILNISDDQKIPQTRDTVSVMYAAATSTFRTNLSKEAVFSNNAADLTAKFNTDLCADNNGQTSLKGKICNRGTAPLPSSVPASFYAADTLLCTARTDNELPEGSCADVECSADIPADTEIIMKANDSGNGRVFAVECDNNNNSSSIILSPCSY